MDKSKLMVVQARKGKVLTESGFKNYDVALNPYVGCQFGCNYCYVRFFIKDKESAWGDFVRTRNHLVDKLPKELKTVVGKRLVMGTMTDPYQPQERKSRLTRSALEIIRDSEHKPGKVGIFTRSPIVVEDAGLIASLPRSRVHFSITPFPKELMSKVEQIPVSTKARFKAVKDLKSAGVRTHVSVAPAIPCLSDSMTEEYCGLLAEAKVDEFFVDPMQTYSDSFLSLQDAMKDSPLWGDIHRTMTDKKLFAEWKESYRESWRDGWRKAGKPKGTLAIWCDHVHHVWEDLITGKPLNPRLYGDDLEEMEARNLETPKFL